MFSQNDSIDNSALFSNTNMSDSMNDTYLFPNNVYMNQGRSLQDELVKLSDSIASKHFFKPFTFNNDCIWYIFIKDKMKLFWNNYNRNYFGKLNSKDLFE